MTDLTNDFGTLFMPQKAFVLYQQNGGNKNVYVESYDMTQEGFPINAHPLSVSEARALAKALQVTEKKENGFLKPKGLLPANVLYLQNSSNPFVIWHTPAKELQLLFREDLGIPCGVCSIPPIVWKAGKRSLAVYALTAGTAVESSTPLFHAPFFNTYEDGHVCMGNVTFKIPKDCPLEDFMSLWEDAFFNSYFSHMVAGHNPVRGNMVQLWKNLSGTGELFPYKSLIKTKITIQHLIR